MSKTVVFIDDDSTANLLVQRLFSKSGYEIRAFVKPDEAREFIHNHVVYALIVDLRMPAISGLDFLESLNLPSMCTKIEHVILQTGAEPESSVRNRIDACGYRMIIKEELFRSINSLSDILES